MVESNKYIQWLINIILVMMGIATIVVLYSAYQYYVSDDESVPIKYMLCPLIPLGYILYNLIANPSQHPTKQNLLKRILAVFISLFFLTIVVYIAMATFTRIRMPLWVELDVGPFFLSFSPGVFFDLMMIAYLSSRISLQGSLLEYKITTKTYHVNRVMDGLMIIMTIDFLYRLINVSMIMLSSQFELLQIYFFLIQLIYLFALIIAITPFLLKRFPDIKPVLSLIIFSSGVGLIFAWVLDIFIKVEDKIFFGVSDPLFAYITGKWACDLIYYLLFLIIGLRMLQFKHKRVEEMEVSIAEYEEKTRV